MAKSAVSGYFSQGVPTVFGALARTIDDTRRTTYTDKNSFATSGMQSFYQKIANKIPGLSMTGQPYVNQWGEEDVESSVLVRIFENFVSPGYLSKMETEPFEAEIQRLYDATGDKSLLPSFAARYYSVGGERVDLTGEQYVEFAGGRGGLIRDVMSALISMPEYKALTTEERADVLEDVYNLANQAAKREITPGYAMNKWVEAALDSQAPIQNAIIARAHERRADEIAAQNRSDLIASISEGDVDSAGQYWRMLEEAGAESGTIKTAVTKQFKPLYQQYAANGDEAAMAALEETLIELGYKYRDIRKWLDVDGE